MKVFVKIIGMLILFMSGLIAYGQQQTDTADLRLPAIDFFQHNKIPTVNGLNPSPSLYSMVNQNAGQLVTASLSFDEQSISIAPLNFNANNARVFDLSLKAGLKEDISYFGGGFNLKFGNKRIERLYRQNVNKYKSVYRSIQNISNPTIKSVESEKFYKFYRSNFIRDIYEEYNWKQLTFHANAMISMFDRVGGNAIDADNDGNVDNFYVIKGFHATGGLTYLFVEKFGISINGNYSERRASAEEGTPSIPYYGGSFTLSKLFVVNKDYLDKESFQKHSFVPGMVLSLAIEYEEASQNTAFAENGIVNEFVVSPMLDFKISPLAQIRLAVSYSAMTLNDNSELYTLRPLIQYNMQLPNF